VHPGESCTGSRAAEDGPRGERGDQGTCRETLLGRIEKIEEALGERLKRDKVVLDEAKDRIEELETQNEEL
jgi:hypothetical protein